MISSYSHNCTAMLPRVVVLGIRDFRDLACDVQCQRGALGPEQSVAIEEINANFGGQLAVR